jgi:hypothetical protein
MQSAGFESALLKDEEMNADRKRLSVRLARTGRPALCDGAMIGQIDAFPGQRALQAIAPELEVASMQTGMPEAGQ